MDSTPVETQPDLIPCAIPWEIRHQSAQVRALPDRDVKQRGVPQRFDHIDAPHQVRALRRRQVEELGSDSQGDGTAFRQIRRGGQPQSGLWFGKTDDLWRFGKPQGWGGPWWEAPILAETPSDPYLMTGFDKKVLHLYHNDAKTVEFRVEVDVLGNGSWQPYTTVPVGPGGYAHHEFPEAFSAHWVRVTIDQTCRATAYFVYT